MQAKKIGWLVGLKLKLFWRRLQQNLDFYKKGKIFLAINFCYNFIDFFKTESGCKFYCSVK